MVTRGAVMVTDTGEELLMKDDEMHPAATFLAMNLHHAFMHCVINRVSGRVAKE